MNRKTWFVLLTLCVVALGASACSVAIAGPAPMNKLIVTANEYAFIGPDTATAGYTEVTIVNQGKELHQVQFVKLDDGKTMDDLMNALQGGDPPAWAKLAGGPNATVPGESSTALVDLQQGTYVILCQIPDAKGVPHFAHGMMKTIKVTAATGGIPAEPAYDTTITEQDFKFTLSSAVKPGVHTFRVDNKGTQPHEAVLVQLPPDKSVMDFVAAFAPDAPPGPPPGKTLGGVTGIMPGDHSYFTANLTPGKYALVCFFDDAASKKPHFALGMTLEFNVR